MKNPATIEIKIHIFTGGVFELLAPSNLMEYDGLDTYKARKFFDTKDEASNYIDRIFVTINNAYNIYNQKQGLISDLQHLRKDKNYMGEYVPPLSPAIYWVGNQEIEIDVIEHSQDKKDFLKQKISALRKEYFELYGTYPTIIGKAK